MNEVIPSTEMVQPLDIGIYGSPQVSQITEVFGQMFNVLSTIAKDEKLSESAVNLVKLFGEKMNQRGSENQTDRNEGFKNEPVQERGEGY